MGANGDISVDSLNMLESLLSFTDSAMLLLGDSALTAFLSKLTAIGKVALGLGFVIFIHELGHFLAAKTFGVRCDKFYVGFDVPIKIGPIRFPRTLGKFKWGETEYGIGIIPLGGYVKMLGQDDDPRKAKEEAEKARANGTEAQPLDPRSYPAKPVWQRMIIISAGVVMNLISAVFLAGAAYFFGVPYTPAVVGRANAGGPAWMADLQPGDQVLRVGGRGNDDPNMRYEDMFQNIVISGIKADGKPVEVSLKRGDEQLLIDTHPSPKYYPSKKPRPLLGFAVSRSTTLALEAVRPFSSIDAKELGLQAKDRIVSVDGEPLPVNKVFDTILSEELIQRMSAKWNQPVKLGVDRPADEASGQSAKQFEVTIPPSPVKSIGLGFAIDAVSAVRPGSPGEKAGFQAGDKILAIDGQEVVDAFELPYQFAAKAGKEVAFTVQRGSEQLELKIQSPAVPTFDLVSEALSGELSLGGVGVAFGVTTTVTKVDADRIKDGSIQVGDKLKQFSWAIPEAAKSEFTSKGLKMIETPQEFNERYNMPSAMEAAQDRPIGSKFNVELEREGKIVSASIPLEYATDRFLTDERGLLLAGITQIHQTSDVMTAMKLGLWETQRRFFDVLEVLKMLVTGGVGVDNFAGPFQLFAVATSEASHGTSRLLLFLTMLSANLAILNFLPIPALDGGHMMFLSWEAIRGKPVDEELQIKLTMVGVLGLLALMAFVIFNDLATML